MARCRDLRTHSRRTLRLPAWIARRVCMTTWNLRGKRALVTGATSGIGRATVTLLAREGARVMATGRKQPALDELTRSNEAPGHSIETLAGDLTDGEFSARLVAATESALGGIDILVNAAGIIATGDWEKTSLEDWD